MKIRDCYSKKRGHSELRYLEWNTERLGLRPSTIKPDNLYIHLSIPTDVFVAERQFSKVIAAAIALFFLANGRDSLRLVDHSDPHIWELNLEIRQMVIQYKRTKWIEHLKYCNLSASASKDYC